MTSLLSAEPHASGAHPHLLPHRFGGVAPSLPYPADACGDDDPPALAEGRSRAPHSAELLRSRSPLRERPGGTERDTCVRRFVGPAPPRGAKPCAVARARKYLCGREELRRLRLPLAGAARR